VTRSWRDASSQGVLSRPPGTAGWAQP
jgi:hypothetical protein